MVGGLGSSNLLAIDEFDGGGAIDGFQNQANGVHPLSSALRHRSLDEGSVLDLAEEGGVVDSIERHMITYVGGNRRGGALFQG